MGADVTSYRLEVPTKIWEEFRKTLMKDDVINEIIIVMISNRIKKYKDFKKFVSEE